MTVPKIVLDENFVVIEFLRLENKDLVLLLKNKDENVQIELIKSFIDFAVKSSSDIHTNSEIKQLQSAASLIQEQLSKVVEKEKEYVNKIIKELQTQLESISGQAIETLDTKLNNFSNEQNAASFLSVLKKSFTDHVKNNMVTDLRNKLNPDEPDSILRPLKISVDDLISNLTSQIQKKKNLRQTAIGGIEFEKEGHLIIAEIAKFHGDFASSVGGTVSESDKKTKTGDTLVQINEAYINGNPIKIVWEFKTEDYNRKDCSEEIRKAMKNREAQIGLIVLRRRIKSQNFPAFEWIEDDKAIVVVEEDGFDENIMRLAYIWAKTQALKTKDSLNESSINVEFINDAINKLKTQLAGLSRVVTHHTGIQTSLNAAVDELRDRRTNIDAEIKALENLLIKE